MKFNTIIIQFAFSLLIFFYDCLSKKTNFLKKSRSKLKFSEFPEHLEKELVKDVNKAIFQNKDSLSFIDSLINPIPIKKQKTFLMNNKAAINLTDNSNTNKTLKDFKNKTTKNKTTKNKTTKDKTARDRTTKNKTTRDKTTKNFNSLNNSGKSKNNKISNNTNKEDENSVTDETEEEEVKKPNVTDFIKQLGKLLFKAEKSSDLLKLERGDEDIADNEILVINKKWSVKTMIFQDFFASASSNTVTKLSQPYFLVLQKIEALIKPDKLAEARKEIKRMRSLEIDEVTDIIVNYSSKIKTEDDYWFYYYITANVVLRGRIVNFKDISVPGLKLNNETRAAGKFAKIDIITPWVLEDNDEFVSRHNKTKRILAEGTDKHYDELLKRDQEYNKILKFFRNLTNYQIKNSTKKIFDEEIRFDKKFVNTTAITKDESNMKEQFRVGWNPKAFQEERKSRHISFLDFEPNLNLTREVKFTPFYKATKEFPKGIIHHLHWSAAFDMNDIFETTINTIAQNKQAGKVSVIIKVPIHLRDRTRPNAFIEFPTPRIFMVEDLEKLLDEFFVKKLYAKETQIFLSNFILSDSSCVIEPFANLQGVEFKKDLKSFLFWKYCKGSVLYNNASMHHLSGREFRKDKDHEVQPLENLMFFLTQKSHIVNKIQTLVSQYLPNSYSNSLLNVHDRISVAVWFKFEMIFGIYSELFEDDNFFRQLTQRLYREMLSQKVKGVEFRQGYDWDKSNSRIKIIQDVFNNNGTEGIPVSFILPGRKVSEGSKAQKILKDLGTAKARKHDFIAGFDFFGYEDDPFTGARNFFPLSARNVEDKNNKENDFAKILESLLQGSKLYLHAGETSYFPNYPANDFFMRKFYINDNLIHAALLPNVARLGHGFAVGNNDLLVSIYRKKGISLEICPFSNQALHYYSVKENPIVRLLRAGLSVTVSPDDPGLFAYSGVKMDWFNLMMQTDLTPSEYYLLIRHSFLKSSITGLKIEEGLKESYEKIISFFDYYDIKQLQKAYSPQIFAKALTLTEDKLEALKHKGMELTNSLRDQVKESPYFNAKNNPDLNVYSIHNVISVLKIRKKKVSGILKNYGKKLDAFKNKYKKLFKNK